MKFIVYLIFIRPAVVPFTYRFSFILYAIVNSRQSCCYLTLEEIEIQRALLTCPKAQN